MNPPPRFLIRSLYRCILSTTKRFSEDGIVRGTSASGLQPISSLQQIIWDGAGSKSRLFAAIRDEFRRPRPSSAVSPSIDEGISSLRQLSALLGVDPHLVQPRAAFDLVFRYNRYCVLDVRPAKAFASFRLRGAINVPYEPAHTFIERCAGAGLDRTVCAVVAGKCSADANAAAAAAALLACGHQHTLLLHGGQTAWREAGVVGLDESPLEEDGVATVIHHRHPGALRVAMDRDDDEDVGEESALG
jgi:rhodanese-related sulfurtransferase